MHVSHSHQAVAKGNHIPPPGAEQLHWNNIDASTSAIEGQLIYTGPRFSHQNLFF